MITEAIKPERISRRDLISFGRSRNPAQQLARQALEPARITKDVIGREIRPLVEAGKELGSAIEEVKRGLNEVTTTVNEALGEALDDKNPNRISNPAGLANSDGSEADEASLEEEETYYPFLEQEPTQISINWGSTSKNRTSRRDLLKVTTRGTADLFRRSLNRALKVALPLSYGLIMQNTGPTARTTQVTEENTASTPDSNGKLSRREFIALAETAVGVVISSAACSPAPGSVSASAARPIGPTLEWKPTPTPSYKEEKNDSSGSHKTLVTDIDLNGTLPENNERKPHIRELTQNLQHLGTPASYYHIVTSSGGEYEAAFEPAYKQTATYKDAKGENTQVEQEVFLVTVIGSDGKPHESTFVFSQIPDTGENVEVAQLSLGVKTADGNIRPDFKSSLMTFYRLKGSNKINIELPDLNGTSGQPILLEFTENTNIDFTDIFEFFLKLGALEAEAAEPTATPTWTQTSMPTRTDTLTPTPFPTLTLTSTATPTSTQTFLPTATRTRIPDTATRRPLTPDPTRLPRPQNSEISLTTLEQELRATSINFERTTVGGGKILILVGGSYGFPEDDAVRIKGYLDWLAQSEGNQEAFNELLKRGVRIIWRIPSGGKVFALNNKWIVAGDDGSHLGDRVGSLVFLGHETGHLFKNSSGTDSPQARCLKMGYFEPKEPNKDTELDAVDASRAFMGMVKGLTPEEVQIANDLIDYAEKYYRGRSICGG